eukprot:jgi/Galph1/1307/GphlegSOOS_G6003.1
MSWVVFDIGEREEALSALKLDKEEPDFKEIEREWQVAIAEKADASSSSSFKGSLDALGEHFSSDSVSLSDFSNFSEDDSRMGESDIDVTELVDDQPVLWVLKTEVSADSLDKTAQMRENFSIRDGTTKEYEPGDSAKEKDWSMPDTSFPTANAVNETTKQECLDSIDWSASCFDHIDPLVRRAVESTLGGVYLSPAAFHFLCQQFVSICLAANRANGILQFHGKDELADSQVGEQGQFCAVPWESTLELCSGISGVPMTEQFVERVKQRTAHILNERYQRRAMRERRKLRLLLWDVFESRYKRRVTERVSLIDSIFQQFGSLHGLLYATDEQIEKVSRVGPKNLELLLAWKRNLNQKISIHTSQG